MPGYCRSSQVNLQLVSKPVSVYMQINKVTINVMYKTNNSDELKDIMKVCVFGLMWGIFDASGGWQKEMEEPYMSSKNLKYIGDDTS
eukprot:2948091-Ditylum_brightwellii.AAC.1